MRDDDKIDCPLFRRLQLFLVKEHLVPTKGQARALARCFMREYWLGQQQANPSSVSFDAD